MKTVNTSNVVLVELIKDENDQVVAKVVSDIFDSKEILEASLERMIEDGEIAGGNYVIAPLYWDLKIEIPEVKAKIKIS